MTVTARAEAASRRRLTVLLAIAAFGAGLLLSLATTSPDTLEHVGHRGPRGLDRLPVKGRPGLPVTAVTSAPRTGTDAPRDGAGDEPAGTKAHTGVDDEPSPPSQTARVTLRQPLLPARTVALLQRTPMLHLMDPGAPTQQRCPEWAERESSSNVLFMREFARILRDEFPPEKGGAPSGGGLHWFLDEGGLIGASRAGAMANADDDFDFFVLLPSIHAPCGRGVACTRDEYEGAIHRFLMVFWGAGMCINKFHPDRAQFRSNGRMMFSFQLNRRPGVPPQSCFQQGKPFGHMHLGMFTEAGRLKTNIWAGHTTHPMDELDVHDMLPVTRCRAGPVDAPCPRNVTAFLTARNRGEYVKSGDGSCLLVRRKWGAARKKEAAGKVQRLHECGYNSMHALLPRFVASGYTSC